jgi:hypothetical protein
LATGELDKHKAYNGNRHHAATQTGKAAAKPEQLFGVEPF